MMNKQVVIFNAPPNSGKDFICDYLMDNYFCNKVEYKSKLRELVKTIYSLSAEQMEWLGLRENKEIPQEVLGGLSFREAMIDVSEVLIKPHYGKDYFAKALLEELVEFTINVVSDGGFVGEVEHLADNECDVYVIRILCDGCDFGGDSRGYLPESAKWKVVDIVNNKDNIFIGDVLNYLKSEDLL